MRYSNTDSSSHEPVSVKMSKSFPPFGRPYPDSAPCLPLPTSQLVAGKTPAILTSYPRLAVQIPPNGTVSGAHSSTGLLLCFLDRPSWERLPGRCFVDLCLRHDHFTLVSSGMSHI